MAFELTTVADARIYAGWSDPPVGGQPTTAQIEALIDAATNALELECDRNFLARDYHVWRSGSGTRSMEIPDWPLNSFSRISTDSVDAINVQCGDATATEAYVEITPTVTDGISLGASAAKNLVLTIADGTNAGSVTIALAGFTTMTLLVAQINATAGSWSATTPSIYGSYQTSKLRPVGRLECYTSIAALEMPDLAEASYITDYDRGIIQLNESAFPNGYRNIYLEYNAGYVTTPPALRHLCHEIMRRAWYETQHDPSLKSETLGDYSWAAATNRLIESTVWDSDTFQRRLAPFKKEVI